MRCLTAASFFWIACFVPAAAQETSVLSGAFTEEQANRGKDLYQAKCSGCHGVELVAQDADFPTLAAPAFKFTWVRKTIGEKFEKIRSTMPPQAKGSLTDQEYIDIVSYILQFNGYPAGDQELPSEPAKLRQMVIEPNHSTVER